MAQETFLLEAKATNQKFYKKLVWHRNRHHGHYVWNTKQWMNLTHSLYSAWKLL